MTPSCHNRPPHPGGHWRQIRWDSRGRAVLRWMPWRFADRCATWDGRGIGPNGEPYPLAHGWDCTGCRWEPLERQLIREAAAAQRAAQGAGSVIARSIEALLEPAP